MTRPKNEQEPFENPIEPTPGKYSRLLPQRFFDHRYHDPDHDEAVSRQSPTVKFRLTSSCAGWPPPHPTSNEFYDAVRADNPTPRQQMLIGLWRDEATWDEIWKGWRDNVYTWAMLARAFRRSGRERAPNYPSVGTQNRPVCPAGHTGRHDQCRVMTSTGGVVRWWPRLRR
ncbi:MAG: hypothetical protein OXG35_32970, partial [Acidobacteria bacterium]|nr:hypothetical protein [Acidobacteriota bacterium]